MNPFLKDYVIKDNPFNRLIIPLSLLGAVIVAGVCGYIFLEGFSFIEALYMVVITLSTVGFGEVRDLGAHGRVLTMTIIVFGVGTVAYTVGQFIEILVEGQIVGYRRRKRMEKKIHEMEGHYIICGYGRVGHEVAKSFASRGISYVVIDSKPETAIELNGSGISYIVGDASSDDTLEAAGVKKAKGLVASSDSDVTNVFVTLSARVLNPKLYIVARASYIESEKKLKKAGADRVISPYFIAGQRIASMALKPVTVEFIDTMMLDEKSEHNIEEIRIKEESKLKGKTIGELEVKRKTGATVLAVKKSQGGFELHPSAGTMIEAGDTIVVLGTPHELHDLENMMV
jgi:voltage-gated potassium channel